MEPESWSVTIGDAAGELISDEPRTCTWVEI